MRRVALALVFLSCSWSQAFAQAPADPVAALCTPPAAGPGVFLYTIDLADKSTIGRRRYQPGDQVQIDLINKNPFRYDYNIKIEEKEIPEPALAAFFKVFNTSPTAALLAAVGKPGDKSRASDDLDCSEGLKVLDQLRTQYAGLKTQAEEITKLFKDLKDVADIEKLQKDQSCKDLVRAASDIRDLIQDAFDESKPDSLGAKLKKFDADLKEYEKAIEKAPSIGEFKEEVKTCRPPVPDLALAEFKVLLESVDSRQDKGLLKVASDFDAAAKEAKTTAKGIADVLKSPQGFYDIRFVGDYDTPTEVTVKVERKEKKSGADFSAYLETKLHFGGRQRFALAAGVAFSRLGQTTYKAVQGFELSSDGSQATGSDGKPIQTRVVGVDEDSNWRATPLILLHARFKEGCGLISGFHASFGFAGNTANNGVNLEYFLGPSISFAEERFFLTLGAYNGRTEKLQKGFFVGRGLPTAITDVPVTRGRSWGLGLAVTVRFQ
jgi:hypothetical protein